MIKVRPKWHEQSRRLNQALRLQIDDMRYCRQVNRTKARNTFSTSSASGSSAMVSSTLALLDAAG